MAQKNVIEIIFDTSHSMNTIAEDNYISRLDVAKYTFKELMEDIIFSSSFKYRIQYFLNCDTILAKADDIHSAKTYGNTPLFRAIGNSLEYLFNFDKSYKKSIIILSDGEDTCYPIHRISEKDIVNFIRKNPSLQDVKIYILKIGKVSAQAEKEYKYLVKKTEGKKYLVDLKNYKKTVESIKKDLHSILNRGKIKSFLYDFFRFTRKIIFMLTSLLIFTLLFVGLYDFFKHVKPPKFLQTTIQKIKQPTQQPTKPIHPKITSHSTTIVDGITVDEFTFKPDKSKKALVYNHNSSKIIILSNFASGKSKLDENSTIFLHDIFEQKINNKINFIKLYGHSDLIPLEPYHSEDCKKKEIEIKYYPNMCLAFERALQVKKSLPTTHAQTITIDYFSDFFMKETNKNLDGTLWKVMKIENNIADLTKELDIKESYNKFTVRRNIKESKKSLKDYKERFSPFRSVVIEIGMH